MPRIGGIILAAGGSTRMGEPKQLLEVNGVPLVYAAAHAAKEGGCDVVCVVTGHAHEAVEQAAAALSPMIVRNEHWQRGMGSSIRIGVEAVQPVSAVILMACDQPAVNSTVIRALIELHHQTGLPVVASQYADTLGIPALFDESCFAELCSLPDEHGAKAIIQARMERVAAYSFPAGALDLDRPEDVQEWMAESGR